MHIVADLLIGVDNLFINVVVSGEETEIICIFNFSPKKPSNFKVRNNNQMSIQFQDVTFNDDSCTACDITVYSD